MLSIASALLRRHVGASIPSQRLSAEFGYRLPASAFARAVHGPLPEFQVVLHSLRPCQQPSVLHAAPVHPVPSAVSSCTALGRLLSAGRHNLTRGFAATSKLRPKHQGGKMKTSGGYKERFKLTSTGKIRHMRTGHRHKRWTKTSNQNRKLRRGRNLFDTYATTLKKLGFTRRTF